MDPRPKKVVGMPDGRIVLKNVHVSHSDLSTTPKNSVKQSFFASLKPFEKTMNFAKDKLMKDRDRDRDRDKEKRSNFGSTPAVNHLSVQKKLSKSDRDIYKIASKPPISSHFNGMCQSMYSSTFPSTLPSTDSSTYPSTDSSSNIYGGQKYALVRLKNNKISSKSPDQVRLRGRNVHHRAASIEDGLGMLATATNDLISYERTPPHASSKKLAPVISRSGIAHSRSQNQIYYPGSSQFTPFDFDSGTPATTMDRYQIRKSQPPPAVQVKPEYIKRNPSNYTSASEARNRSIDKSNDYVESLNTTAMGYYSQRRQSCHFMSSQDRNSCERYVNSSTTGSTNSTPRKPASVVEWPAQNVVSTTPIHPQERSSETPTDGTTTTTSEGSPAMNNDSRYSHRLSTHFADVSLHPPQSPSTTFGTDPLMKNYSTTSNIYVAEPASIVPQSGARYSLQPGSESFSHQNNQNRWEHNNTGDSQSPMSSGNSSATTTTINTVAMIPTIFGQNGTNKIAVAPLPQKRVSHRKEEKEHHSRHHQQRQSIGPSPYQVSTPAVMPTSKSAQKLNRLSNEVYIDGPTPTPMGDGQTDVRVSFLEDRVRDMERAFNRSSRQNMIFSPTGPTEAQQLMMQDLIDKNVLIGQLEARVRTLAAQVERQQMDFENEKKQAQLELAEAKKGHATNKKRIQTLQEHLDEYEKLFRESMKSKEDEIDSLQMGIKQKQEEILGLNIKVADLSNNVKNVENLQSLITSKDSRIAELESMINDMKQAQTSDRNHNSLKKANSGVETLSEIEEASNDEGDSVLSPRSGTITPTAFNKTFMSGLNTSSTSEKLATVLPNSFNNLLRNHYRRTQICHDLASNIAEATTKILEGKTSDAARMLGYYTDTEAEDSEALVSESPNNAKMSVGTAEKYLRKECDMLEKVEKKMSEIRLEYFQMCKKQQSSRNADCKMQ